MCILSMALDAHPDLPLVLTHNRDEFHARTASHVQQHDDGVLCALDAESGGTWMGVNVRTGAFAALTNVRCGRPPAPTRSRGELVARVLRGDVDAVPSSDYAAFNLVHGVLRPDGAPADLSLSVSSPAAGVDGACDGERRPWRTHTSPIAHEPGLPRVVCKSNDAGGGLTGRAAARQLLEECGTGAAAVGSSHTWPKAAWLQAEVEAALEGLPRDLAGEPAARALLSALEPSLSASGMPPPFGGMVDGVGPSSWSPLNDEEERTLHRGPFIAPVELRDGAAAAAYGTVSQSVLIQSRRAGCLFYIHRQTLPAAADAPREGSPAAAWDWQWHTVPLPAVPP